MDHQIHSMKNVAYTRGYYRMLSPSAMATALTLQGWTPPDLRASLNYCELGMGYGISLLANAACFPRMRFHGVDFNAEHVAYARGLADRAALPNVELHAMGFDDMVGAELPKMDFITLHGIWSWISPQLRNVITEFIGSHLAPGGVVCISHNVPTGWASIAPLRDWIVREIQHTAGPDESPFDQLSRAIAELQALRRAQARYFADNPEAAAWVDSLPTLDPNYLVHELLTEHWHPQHAHEVARELAVAGLKHAGAAEAPMTVPERWLPGPACAALARATNAGTRESLHDLLFNPMLRRDLYVRSATPLSTTEREVRSLALEWVATSLPSDEDVATIDGPYAKLFSDDDVACVLEALADGPASVVSLLKHPSLDGWDAQKLLRALALMDGQHVQPALPPEMREEARPGAARFNDIVLSRGRGEGLNFLANPSSGVAIGWSADALRQFDAYRCGAQDLQSLLRALEPVDAALPTGFASRLRRFIDERAPALSRLGVL